MTYAGGIFSTADPNDRKLRKYSDSELLKRLVKYILKYRKNFAIVLGTLTVASAVGVAGPALVGEAANYIVAFNLNALVLSMALFAGIYVANYFSDYERTVHIQILGQNVIRDIRSDSFAKLQELSPSYFSKRETGRIMSCITNDVDALSDFVTFQLPQVLTGFVVILSMIVIMVYFNLDLTLISLTVIPPLVLITLAFQGRIQVSFVETRKKIAMVTSKLQEGITGVRVTQSFTEESRVSRNFDEVNSENLQANLRANKLTSLFNALVNLVESSGIAIVLWYGASEIMGGQLSVGTLVTFILYVNAFFAPIIQLTTFYNSYQSAVTGLDRVLQVIDSDIEVKEPQAVKVDLAAPQGVQVQFRNVTFRYANGVPPALNNVSLKIDRGEVIAIVGPTGAGKSSIVNLMLRFYDPQSGQVMIDGIDLKELKFYQFRKIMGVIPQDPFLFSTTIMENIRFGKPEAMDEEVIKISKKIGFDEFVSKLPHGYGTVVNEGASNLSMGQKQLICFARAFLSNPKLLVMDEATSGVDPITELQLQRALATMLEGRTVVIIAHRLSTIRLADKIVVIEGGEITEEGTFAELMTIKDGKFASMYRLSTSYTTNGNTIVTS